MAKLFFFIFGVVVVGFFNNISSIIVISAGLLSAFFVYRKNINLKKLLLYIIMFALGVAFNLCYNKYIFDKYGQINDTDEALTITVVSDVTYDEKYINFTGKIEEYSDVKAKVSLMSEEKIEYYDVITLKGDISSFEAGNNNSSFDNKLYNYSDRIYLTVTSKNTFKVIAHKKNFMTLLYNLKEKVSYIIDMNFSHNGSMLLRGILLGDDADRTKEFDDALSKTGLTHIVVVSGMHFTIINMLLVSLLRRFRIKRKATSAIAIPVSVILAMFIGFSVSVVRALIMIIILNIADLINRERKTDIYLVTLTAFIMIILNPYIIHNAGFVLSFMSVCGIVLLNDRLHAKLKFIPALLRSPICVSLSANIFTFPFVVYYFNGIPTLFIFSNLIITLYISFIMGYGFIVILLSFINMRLGSIIAIPLDSLISFTLNIITYISEIPISYLSTLNIEKHIITVYYTAIFMLCNMKTVVFRYIVPAVMLIYFILVSFVNLNTYLFNYADVYAFCGADGGKVIISYKGNNIFIDLSVSNKKDYSSYINSVCNGDVDVCILGSAFNFKAVKNYRLNAEILYYPEGIILNEYTEEIISDNFEKAILIREEINLKYDDMHLTLKLDESYNIDEVIIEFNERKLIVTNNFQIHFNRDYEYIITDKMMKLYDFENILNSEEKEVERIRL